MYDMKALYQARSVRDAVALRLAHPEAQIIAGGSDVLVQMREGKRAGAELNSIQTLDEIRGVSLDADGTLRIGSLTSFSHITRDPLIQKYINVLGEAVDQVGGPQIRNIGTIGGNTCNGVTSADSASTLHAWDAVVELTGPEGVRRQPIQEFYIRAGVVDLREGSFRLSSFQGRVMRTASAIISSMPCGTPWTSPPWGPPSMSASPPTRKPWSGSGSPSAWRVPCPCGPGRRRAWRRDGPSAWSWRRNSPRPSRRTSIPGAAEDFRLHIAVESAKRAFIESVKLAGGEL